MRKHPWLFILFIVFVYSLDASIIINGTSNKIDAYNNTTFFEFVNLTWSDLPSDEIDGLDIDVYYILQSGYFCKYKSTYYILNDVQNITNYNCSLNSDYSVYNIIYEYFPDLKQLNCSFYIGVSNANEDCQKLSETYNFTLSSKVYPKYTKQDKVVYWQQDIWVWHCNNDYDACSKSYGYDIPAQTGILNQMTILAPSPNLSAVFPCEDSINLSRTIIPYNLNTKPKSYKLYLYKDDVFNLTLNATNVHDTTHSGKSFYNWVNLTQYELTYLTLSSPQNLYIGNMSSGQTNLTSFTFTANQLKETFPTNLLFNLSDFSGNYNDSVLFNVYILNLTIPYFYLPSNIIEQGYTTNFILNVSGNATSVSSVKIYHSSSNKPTTSGLYTETQIPSSCYETTNCQFNLYNFSLTPGFYNLTAEATADRTTINYTVENPLTSSYDLLVWNTTIYNISITKEIFDLDETQNITFNVYSAPEKVENVTIEFFRTSDGLIYSKTNTTQMDCSNSCFYTFNTSELDIGQYSINIIVNTIHTTKTKLYYTYCIESNQ